MAHIDDSAAFLVKGHKAYRIKAHNPETGRIDLETEFGVALVVTAEAAQKNGYTAARGFVRKTLGESKVVYQFVDEAGKPFTGVPE